MILQNTILKNCGNPPICDLRAIRTSPKNRTQRRLTKRMGFVPSLSAVKGGAI